MEFQDYLRHDIEHIGCSLSELSRASGLSSAVISRYRSGERIPRPDSEMLVQLCNGLSQLEAEAGLKPMSSAERLKRYRSAIGNKPHLQADHLNKLLETLHISMKDLSLLLNYDASYLSRIRAGKRSPADPAAFALHVSRSLLETLRPDDQQRVAVLVGLRNGEDLNEVLASWLIQRTPVEGEHIVRLLSTIDSFDLNQFIRFMHFEERKIGGVVIPENNTVSYYSTEGLRDGELNFFRTILASSGTGPIYMCNDFPMEEMADDRLFVKQWMSLIAECLKKGHHIYIIHDISRPFPEMMLGLETWIPAYMTGQITPYYLPSQNSSIYRHCLYASEACVLSGEGIGSSTKDASSTLSTDPERIAYGKTRARQLFSHSSSLMNIIRSSRKEEFMNFWAAESSIPGERHIWSCVPPIYTLTRDLLASIMEKSQVDVNFRTAAEQFRITQLNFINQILRGGNITIDILRISDEEFLRYPPQCDAPFWNEGQMITYSPETYKLHLDLTREFAATHPGFTLRETSDYSFRNLFVYVRDEKQAVIVKQKNPQICFVIKQPQMITALSNFTSLLSDV